MSTISFASCEENTSFRLCRKRKVLNEEEGEIITVPGCIFRVYRKRTTKNVYSCSFWIGAEEYLTTLINSLYWWANEFPKHVLHDKKWNVRLYIDGLVMLEKPINESNPDITWKSMLEWLSTKSHLEIWLYECTAGYNKKNNADNQRHVATFGSLLRMHALTDPTLETVALRNIEGLTTSVDHQRLLRWKEMVQIKRDERNEKNELFFSVTLLQQNKHHRIALDDLRQEYKKEGKQLSPVQEIYSNTIYPQICACYYNVDMTLNHPATTWSEIMRYANLWHTTTNRHPEVIAFSSHHKIPYGYGVDEYVLIRLFWKLFYDQVNNNVQYVHDLSNEELGTKFHIPVPTEFQRYKRIRPPITYTKMKNLLEIQLLKSKKPSKRLLKINPELFPKDMSHDWVAIFQSEASIVYTMIMDWSNWPLNSEFEYQIEATLDKVAPGLFNRLKPFWIIEKNVPHTFILPGWNWKHKTEEEATEWEENARIDFFTTADFQTTLHPSIFTSFPKKAKSK